MAKTGQQEYVPRKRCLKCTNRRYPNPDMDGLCLSCYYEGKNNGTSRRTEEAKEEA